MRSRSLCMLLVVGCGSNLGNPADPPPPDPATFAQTPIPSRAEPVASASSSAASTPPMKGPSLGGFGLVFQTKTNDWTNEVVIAPWGDVVAIGGHRARLLARDSGKELLSVSVCFTQSVDAAAFIDDHRMVIACKDEVDELTFPEGRVKQLFKFPIAISETAVGGGRVVAGVDGFFQKNNNHVTVYAVDGFRIVDEFDASGKIEAVAISADGNRVAVGTDKEGVDVRDIAKKSTVTLLPKDNQRHSAVHFSPDASRLFSDDTGSWEGGELVLATGKAANGFKTGSWLRAIRHVTDTEILATGSEGLVLYSGKSDVTAAPIARLGEGLDLSADRSYFCAAGRDGDVACFSKKPTLPSTFVARAPASSGASPGAGASASSGSVNEVDGVLVSRAGKVVTITLSDPKGVAVGQHGQLSKHFEQNLGFVISGFITIASVEVKAVSGNKVTLTILEEKSAMLMNGKPVNQFTPKAAVKLTLTD